MKAPTLCAVALLMLAAHLPTLADQGEAVPVEVVNATIARVARLRWVPGSIVSRNDARLATSAAGRLEYVAEVGTSVRAGERVAKLEDAAVSLRVADAQAETARIESQRAAAERQAQRFEKLANSVSQTQLDEARSQLSVLAAQLQQAQVRHRLALHEVAQTELRAPFPGIVTERLAQRGEYVTTGAAIARLVDTTHLEARVQAPLSFVDLVKPSMSVPLKAGKQQLRASVRAIVPVGTERSRQFELRLKLEPQPLLTVGSAIEVGLPESAAADALVVPRDAVVIRQDGSYLMRVRADSTAERVAVTTEAAGGGRVTVRGAVHAGDTIVVRGLERLQHGQRVRVTKRDSGSAERPSALSSGRLQP
jgi:RND family efflux transporter MFP subunit